MGGLSVHAEPSEWSVGLGLGPNLSQLDAVGDRLKSSVGASVWATRSWGERQRLDVALDYFSFSGSGRSYPGLSVGYGLRILPESKFKPFVLVGAGVGQANNFPLALKSQISTLHMFGRVGLEDLYKTEKWSLGLVGDFIFAELDGKPIDSAQLALPMLTITWNLEKRKDEPVKKVDSDKDGVYDDKDECPDTPRGTKVNSIGCPKGQKVIKSLQVEFETAKAIVKPSYMKVLDAFGQFLKDNPDLTVTIEGHTDSVGKDDYNMRLSLERTTEVRRLLIERWQLAPDRLNSEGYGETRPIADNETAEGRAKNRRVITILDSR
jgi:outer membrane protein OmpA-like peptidoglycan-associated protein